MNLQALLQWYLEDPRLQKLEEALSCPGPAKIQFSGLSGSSASMIAYALWARSDRNHVFLMQDREEAAFFHNDLENLSQALDIHFFPDSFRKTGNFRSLNSSHIMLRTEALMKFATGQVHKKILVTYPEALLEKVVPAGKYAGLVIRLRVGEALDLDDLLGNLSRLGFSSSDFVFEPGQYAVRGGIVDIYSFGNEKPYRLELFGHEIESIRLFDPETQLSERKLVQVTLIPDLDQVSSAGDRIPLFDYLPSNTLWWVRDLEFALGALREQDRTLSRYFREAVPKYPEPEEEEEENRALPGLQDFVRPDDWEEKLQSLNLIDFGGHGSLEKRGWQSTTIAFHTSRQPVFNRRFDLLITDLRNYAAQGYSLFLFAENPKQLERLQSVFEDLKAEINFFPIPLGISQGFLDQDNKLLCYTDHEIFQRYHKYRIKQAFNKNKALTMRALREFQPGDYITHVDHGVGIFSGLQKIEINGKTQEAVRILYRDQDILYVNINSLHKISKFSGKEGSVPRINKLGSDTWEKLKEKTKNKVKDIAKDLIRLYASRKSQEGFAHSPDTYLQTELEASFLYEDTPDQGRAVLEVKRDMEAPSPMDRLICGDVGFGKTEVAVRAAFKTLVDGKQAAILVPTTILAFQHYKTFSDRLNGFPCRVEFLNRFKSAKEKKTLLSELEQGRIDIIIGTHVLLGKEVRFHDLGILIVDEEQKFGVSAKEKLKQLRTHVDTLTLTATPIPRTLQFSLMGARDLSIINTPPPNRQPIQTEVREFSEELIRDAIYFETEREGQVFFIHNRVQNIREITALLQQLCPDLNIAYAHGKMEGHQLEQVVMDFINRRYDVLVCTNIVESGVDIPNANTMVVNNAHHFGLSDLHQLRGRVGRSNKKAFCYLLAPPLSTLPADSRKRLQTLELHSELGSGFQIAMRDLDIRGAGNLLGAEQSGFMAEIGFDMYHKILDEAIRELKQTEFRDLFASQLDEKKDYVRDSTLDTDLEILIPDDYVSNITERLSLYQQLDSLEGEEALDRFRLELQDRFGPIPPQVQDLFRAIRCRRLSEELGFEKVILKEGIARCYFINNPDSSYFESAIFRNLVQFLQKEVHSGKLKQRGKNFLLVLEPIRSMEELEALLHRMASYAPAEGIPS